MGCKSVLTTHSVPEKRFLDVDVNPDPRAVPQCCREMFTNINGLHGNRDELAIATNKFDDVAYVETKVTGRRHVFKLLLPVFNVPTLLLTLLRGARPNGLGMALLVRSGLSVSWQERFECFCSEFMVAKIPGSTVELLFVCCLLTPSHPSTDDRVFDYLHGNDGWLDRASLVVALNLSPTCWIRCSSQGSPQVQS